MAKGPFMEFLRASVVLTAADAYTETQIPTPTSKTENLAMLIHSIELDPAAVVDATPTNADESKVHLSKRTQTIWKNIGDPDILAHFKAKTHLAAIFHHLAISGSMKHTFDPPILYPHANLFLGMDTVGWTSVTSAVCRIGYTLEKVSREDFISALVE